MKSIDVDKDLELTSQEGYLLMSVETVRDLKKIIISGKKKIELTTNDLKEGSNYILLPLPAGKYKIEKVFTKNKIYFEFDEHLEEGIWRFNVAPNVISYIGNLEAVVSSSGWRGRFEFVNQSSQALEYLEKEFPTILESRKIQYTGPGEDRFFQLISGEYPTTKAGEGIKP
jgi:hypothetical protein